MFWRVLVTLFWLLLAIINGVLLLEPCYAVYRTGSASDHRCAEGCQQIPAFCRCCDSLHPVWNRDPAASDPADQRTEIYRETEIQIQYSADHCWQDCFSPEVHSLHWKREYFPIISEILPLPMKITDIRIVWQLLFSIQVSVVPGIIPRRRSRE